MDTIVSTIEGIQSTLQEYTFVGSNQTQHNFRVVLGVAIVGNIQSKGEGLATYDLNREFCHDLLKSWMQDAIYRGDFADAEGVLIVAACGDDSSYFLTCAGPLLTESILPYEVTRKLLRVYDTHSAYTSLIATLAIVADTLDAAPSSNFEQLCLWLLFIFYVFTAIVSSMYLLLVLLQILKQSCKSIYKRCKSWWQARTHLPSSRPSSMTTSMSSAKHTHESSALIQKKFQSRHCPICFENFDWDFPNLDLNDIPRLGPDGKAVTLLGCGHMYCDGCWARFTRVQRNPTPHCPCCQRGVKSGYGT